MFRRTLSVLVILVLSLAVLVTGCTQPPVATSTPAPTATPTRDVGLGLKVPLTTSGETISILLSQNEGGKDWNTDTFPILQAIEKVTGVKLLLEAYPSDTYGTVVDARLAAKSAIPDMFVADQRKYDLQTLTAVKVIVPLQDLMAANAPNTTAFIASRKDVKDYVTSNGIIYGFPGLVRDSMFDLLLNLYRQDWVDAAGIKFADGTNVPKTFADWELMLTTFKTEGDPMIEGEDLSKIVPLELWAPNKLSAFAAGYDLSPQSKWLSTTADGTVVYDFVGQEAKAKAFVTLMAKWYANGLIDQQFGDSGHGNKGDADVAGNLAGADVEWSGYAMYWNKNFPSAVSGKNQNWMIAKCPTSEVNANPGYEQYPLCNYERWLVTTSAKNPALVVKWLDYVFATEEGKTLMNYGIKGTDYTVNADGVNVFTDTVLKAEGGGEAYLSKIGISRFPRQGLYAAMSQLIGASPLQGGSTPEIGDAMKAYLATARTFFPDVVATKDEGDQLGSLMTTIDDYTNGMFLQFVIGKKNLTTDWDAFVASLKADYQVEKIITIKQAQYNRFVGK